jgi:hypothetical protein
MRFSSSLGRGYEVKGRRLLRERWPLGLMSHREPVPAGALVVVGSVRAGANEETALPRLVQEGDELRRRFEVERHW